MAEHEHEALVYLHCEHCGAWWAAEEDRCLACGRVDLVRYVPPCCVRAARREALELAAVKAAERMVCPIHASGIYDNCAGCAMALEANDIAAVISALAEEPRDG